MMISFAFKKGGVERKTQDANSSLPIKNPNPLLKTDSGFQNWADSGFGLPTLFLTLVFLLNRKIINIYPQFNNK